MHMDYYLSADTSQEIQIGLQLSVWWAILFYGLGKVACVGVEYCGCIVKHMTQYTTNEEKKGCSSQGNNYFL